MFTVYWWPNVYSRSTNSTDSVTRPACRRVSAVMPAAGRLRQERERRLLSTDRRTFTARRTYTSDQN